MKMRWVTKFNLGIKQVLIQKLGTALEQEQTEVSKKGSDSDKQRYVRNSSFQRGRKEPALEQKQSEVSKKGPAFSGWALSGATRRAEQKWMLFERSEFHPFPARSKAE